MTTSLPHTHVHMHRHILSRSSVGVIWQWPSGSFFSICVGLTHFSPRPHPTVPFPKHMCGGRGISESAPRGTCWHRLQIWHWTLISCLSASHIICHHQYWPQGFSPLRCDKTPVLLLLLPLQVKDVCITNLTIRQSRFVNLFLLMQSMCVYNMYLPSIDFQMSSWLCISFIS